MSQLKKVQVSQMANRTLFIDLAAYQPDTLDYFQKMWALGVRGAVVKLTEGSEDGSAYINPKAGNQIKNAKAVGMKVSAYHFARYTSNADAKNEANFFVKTAQSFGLPSDTVMVIDAEVKTAADYTGATLSAMKQVESLGYKTTAVYAARSFWQEKILDESKLYNIWLAGYGIKDLYVKNAIAWQYDDKFKGYSQDINYDFTGLFTSGKTTGSVPEMKSATVAASKKTISVTGTFKDGDWTITRENGTFTAGTTLRVFAYPGIQPTGAKYAKGESVIYDGYVRNGNYIYISYQIKGGYHHYIAVRENGNPLGTFK